MQHSLIRFAGHIANHYETVLNVDFWKLLVSSYQLDFDMEMQTQTNWCWAACATSVSHYYWPLSGWSQCTVANKHQERSDCCNSPVPSACNQYGYLDKALDVTKNHVSYGSGMATEAEIRTEIDAGRPVGTRTAWSGGGAHFLFIYGYYEYGGTFYLDLDDPIYGKSRYAIDDFATAYQGSGSWTHTYYTKSYFPYVIVPIEIHRKLWEKIWEFQAGELLSARAGSEHADAAAARLRELRAGKGADFALPHGVYNLSFSRKGRKATRMPEEPAKVRLFEMSGRRVAAIYDLRDDPRTPAVLGVERTGERLQRLADTVDRAIRTAEGGKARTELRILRVPELYLEAVWLRKRGTPDEVHVVPGMHPLETEEAYEVPKFLAAVNAAMRDRPEADETSGG